MTKIYAQGEVELKAACHAIMFLDPELEWEIDVNKKKKRRSSSQNALMWMWLDKIAKAMSDKTGYEVHEMHILFKNNFLDGKKISVGGLDALEQTTTSLTTAEMSKYLDKIQRFCASEMGVFVPLPEEAQLR